MLPQEALAIAGVKAVGEAGSWGRSINNEFFVVEGRYRASAVGQATHGLTNRLVCR